MLTFVEQWSLDRETTSGLVVRSEATKLSNVISAFPTLCLNIKGVTGKKVHSQILGLAELKYYRVLCCSTFHNPKNPWRRKWQPTPVFLPEKSKGGAWWATVYGVAKESDLAVIQQQYTNVHCELPKEVYEYGLSHIYLTMESGFFFLMPSFSWTVFPGAHISKYCPSSDEGAETSRSSHLPPCGPFWFQGLLGSGTVMSWVGTDACWVCIDQGHLLISGPVRG